MTLAIMIGVLTGGGVYLMMQRGMVRVVFGLGLFSHAVNLMLLTAGVSAWRREPLADVNAVEVSADPLPQAFVLTAIVITLAVTVFMLSLAVVSRDDDTHRIPDTGQGPPADPGPAGAEPSAAGHSTARHRTIAGQEGDA
ncbi:MAG TPA: cation:proton antiporter subunit C [Candidatus Dietzia intestinigallinarum]|nr:cation:proton antiporter subunit C [Candidatus Dietzia intestinigallinarum]